MGPNQRCVAQGRWVDIHRPRPCALLSYLLHVTLNIWMYVGAVRLASPSLLCMHVLSFPEQYSIAGACPQPATGTRASYCKAPSALWQRLPQTCQDNALLYHRTGRWRRLAPLHGWLYAHTHQVHTKPRVALHALAVAAVNCRHGAVADAHCYPYRHDALCFDHATVHNCRNNKSNGWVGPPSKLPPCGGSKVRTDIARPSAPGSALHSRASPSCRAVSQRHGQHPEAVWKLPCITTADGSLPDTPPCPPCPANQENQSGAPTTACCLCGGLGWVAAGQEERAGHHGAQQQPAANVPPHVAHAALLALAAGRAGLWPAGQVHLDLVVVVRGLCAAQHSTGACMHGAGRLSSALHSWKWRVDGQSLSLSALHGIPATHTPARLAPCALRMQAAANRRWPRGAFLGRRIRQPSPMHAWPAHLLAHLDGLLVSLVVGLLRTCRERTAQLGRVHAVRQYVYGVGHADL